MHVFHLRGFSGVLVFLTAAISAVLLFMLLPASFMMVLWNALIFESFHGPEIGLIQGFFLWGFVMVLLKMIFKPEIKFEFQSMPVAGKKSKPQTKTDVAEESESTANALTDERSDR